VEQEHLDKTAVAVVVVVVVVEAKTNACLRSLETDDMMVEMHDLSVSKSHEQDPLQCHECSKAETQTEHFGAERYFDFVVGKKQESWMQRHDWSGAPAAGQ
jgi:aspartyl-tRNA synthetase